MHFVGMLAAPLPPDTVYLVLPTIISFLICALVVGISLFFVSVGEPSLRRVISSAVLLGVGIASMHYVGIHGLQAFCHRARPLHDACCRSWSRSSRPMAACALSLPGRTASA